MEERRITVPCWQHIPAGESVPDGYGRERTAPKEPGLYTLYELADERNQHQGWTWEREG